MELRTLKQIAMSSLSTLLMTRLFAVLWLLCLTRQSLVSIRMTMPSTVLLPFGKTAVTSLWILSSLPGWSVFAARLAQNMRHLRPIRRCLRMPKFRSAYDYSTHVSPALDTGPECCVQQHFSDQVDANNIVKRYVKAGLIRRLSDLGGFTMDMCAGEPLDLEAKLNAQVALEEYWSSQPKNILERFKSPTEFYNFLASAENRPEAEKLGLVAPLPPVSAAVDAE